MNYRNGIISYNIFRNHPYFISEKVLCFAEGGCGNNRLFIYGKMKFLLRFITKYVITGTSWYNKYRS
ncbi:hypothetical protein PDK25_22910, partial [Bacillus cereus group sp. TH242-3LC]|nr:hypothetical protein [Bacillus cereus group sp. TH242-3LC]